MGHRNSVRCLKILHCERNWVTEENYWEGGGAILFDHQNLEWRRKNWLTPSQYRGTKTLFYLIVFSDNNFYREYLWMVNLLWSKVPL